MKESRALKFTLQGTLLNQLTAKRFDNIVNCQTYKRLTQRNSQRQIKKSKRKSGEVNDSFKFDV